MIFESGDWPIRSIPRSQIVDNFLIRHTAFTLDGQDEASARSDVEAVIDRWLGLGLKVAKNASGEQVLDPAEATNFMVSAGLQGLDDFWSKNYVATERRLVELQAGLPPGSDIVPIPTAEDAGHRYLVHLERVYDTRDASSGSRARLRLPLPVEDHALRKLELNCRAPDGATVRQQPARMDVSLTLDTGLVTLEMTAAFEAATETGMPSALSEGERARYTEPREELIHISNRVRAVAEETTAGLTDDWQRTIAIWDYLLNNFMLGAVPYHALQPDDPSAWSFKFRFLDCQLGSSLFCALCRSLGIPARVISGYQLYAVNASYHYWAQVWIPGRGWLSFDLSAWHLSRGGTDLRWRKIFAGTMNHRMKTQVLPDLFTGPSTRRFPPAWHMLFRHLPSGLEISFVDARSGALIYRDRLTMLKS